MFKVAEHSLFKCSCWCNTAHAQGLQKKKDGIVTVIIWFEYSILMVLLFDVRKGTDAKNPEILRFFFVVIESGIDYSEIHLFLKNHFVQFNKIWHKNTLGNE